MGNCIHPGLGGASWPSTVLIADTAVRIWRVRLAVLDLALAA
jgi:hypothetical protein